MTKTTIFVMTLIAPMMCMSKPINKTKVKVYHVCTKQDSSENALACALYQEARGERFKGMWAVGNVVLNRKNHGNYPDKIRKVLYQKGQFTYTKHKNLKVTDKESWDLAKKASKTLIILNNNFPRLRDFLDNTNGSIYFYQKKKEPMWMKQNYDKKLTYRGHVFYADKDSTIQSIYR